MQQTLGNQAVQRLYRTGVLQAKLKIGAPGDKYEQEADRVADQVMRMPEPIVRRQAAEEEEPVQAKPLATQITPLVQRQPAGEEEEPTQAKFESGGEAAVQRQEEKEDEFAQTVPLQRQAAAKEEEEQVQAKFDSGEPQLRLQTEGEDESFEQTESLKRRMNEDEEEQAHAQTKSLTVQRLCPECEKEREEEVTIQRAINYTQTPIIQRPCLECEKKLQRQPMPEEEVEKAVQTKLLYPTIEVKRQVWPLQPKSANGYSVSDSPTVEANISAMKGGGIPLPSSARVFFESRFGADFGDVRLHTDSRAADTAKSINARAFTVGSDIAFGSGQYSPDSSSGRSLLAHELTHVVQQGQKFDNNSKEQTNVSKIKKPDSNDSTEEEVRRKDISSESLTYQLRHYLYHSNLEESIRIIRQLSNEEKNEVLSSEVHKNRATGKVGTGDPGDFSVYRLIAAFTENGYRNLYGCLDWMLSEFDKYSGWGWIEEIVGIHSIEERKKIIENDEMKRRFSESYGDKEFYSLMKNFMIGISLEKSLEWMFYEAEEPNELVWDRVKQVIELHSVEKRKMIYHHEKMKGNFQWAFSDAEVFDAVQLMKFTLHQKLDWMIYADTNAELVLKAIAHEDTTPSQVDEVLADNELMSRLENEPGEESEFESVLQKLREYRGVVSDEAVFEPSEAELEELEEGEGVGQQGVVQADEGTNLWPEANRDVPALGLLPLNTRVFVDRKIGQNWYSVYVERHQRGNSLPVAEGTHGYVDASRVSADMPDPDAWLFRITKIGQGALSVAGEVYPDHVPTCHVWGHACEDDYRYLVNVLVFVNEAKNRKGINKDNPGDSWRQTKTKLNTQIWVPGWQLVTALKGHVESGSISYEVLQTLKDIGIGIAAFGVGLLHGALMSIADIFIGAWDLLVMLWDIVVKLFKGTLISDAIAFFKDISKIKVSDIIALVGAKWNAPSTWDRWKFRGYVIGYAIVEILLMIFSVGILTAIKWAGKVSKLGKFAKYLSELPKVQKVMKAAKALKGKGIDKIRATLKAANALSESHGWAARVLRLPMNILNRLSEADIGKLKNLPQWIRERFARLADSVKLRVLGCASPCKVDVREIEAALKLAGAGGKKLDSAKAVLDALPPGLNKAKIWNKLRKKDSALLTAIKEAELTDADFSKLEEFLTPGDLENPAQAYKTFARYLTAVVPAKTGKDIDKLNKILAAMIKTEPPRGKALKGSMFEQWVTLHVPDLASRNFTRITFDLKNIFKKKFPPYSKQVDKWVPDKGEIWEMKHQLGKVPPKQADDYAGLLGEIAPDGKRVWSVNYLFPTEAAAKMNKNLADAYGFGVYYIDKVTNELTKLY